MIFRRCFFDLLLCILLLFPLLSNCQKQETAEEDLSWPEEVAIVEIKSTADGVMQPAYFWTPDAAHGDSEEKRPLLVALHSWSFGYEQVNTVYFTESKKREWIFIHPHFRGPNNRPQACGSSLVVQDILDAVEYAKSRANVDESRIYIVGGSGGGYAALLMAGRAPDVWAGISAWVPITDLAAWHHQSKSKGTKYFQDIESACGGAPGASDEIDNQYAERSAITHLPNAAGISIDLNVGIHDGHTGSVPVSQTLYAFNILAEVNGLSGIKLSEEQISGFVKNRKVPESLRDERAEDPAYTKSVLFRREAGPVRLTVFDGGHDILMETAFVWLEQQKKE